MTLSRRDLLTTAAAAAGIAAAHVAPLANAASRSGSRRAGAAAAPPRAFDPDDATQVRYALRRMHFSTSSDTFCWWMRGTRFAVIESRAVPLFEMHVGTIMRCRDAGAAGEFDVTSLEIVFNTDPATGALVEHWPNPFTGETVDLQIAPVGPNTMHYGANGAVLPTELPGSKIESVQRTGRPVVEGDDIWIDAESRATVTPNAGGTPFRVNDLSTYRSRLSAVLDPAVAFVECDVSYNDVTSWPRWMRMGDRPGNRFARASGRKVAHYDAMPRRWREVIAERFPKIAADPAAALDLPPFRFER
jgi:hypothetical protein